MWRIKLFYMGESERVSIPYLEDHTAVEKSISELEILGLSVSAHPLRRYGVHARVPGVMSAVDLCHNVGKVVKLTGWLVTAKRTRTKHGELMKFLTMEDETDIFEVTLFPKVYARFGHILRRDHGPYIVTGKVENDGGDVTVTGRGIERIMEGAIP
jgi:DNA polymerase III alpha subunit